MLSQHDVRLSRQAQRTVFRPILELDLLGERAAGIDFCLHGQPPRLAREHPPAGKYCAGGPRQGDRSLETREAVIKLQNAIGVCQ